MGDEFRGIGEFGSTFTRMPIEDHYDFPPDEGSVLLPFRDFPENWDSAPDVASLNFLDRDFIFPGEQFHILVHVSAEDTSGPEIVTPFKVAAAMNKLAAKKAKEQASSADAEADQDEAGSGEIRNIEEQSIEAVKASEHQDSSTSGLSPSPTTLLQREGNRKRSLGALEDFRKSHYYVRIRGKDEPLWQKRVVGSANGAPVSRVEGKAQGGHSSKPNPHGCIPVLMEAGKFDPHSAGGVARNAVACSVLGNGDIVVLLEVTMASESIADDAVMDVLQFERYEPLVLDEHSKRQQQQQARTGGLDPTQGLLQWLLPLDRPSSPPPSLVGAIHSSPPKSTLTPTNSNLFSFVPLRSSSTGGSGSLQASHLQSGAVPVPIPAPVPPPTFAPPPMYGSKVWDSALQERSSKAEVGSEGLLSFRGAVLEPQRFSAHHGLEGLHVPGKRWSRKLSVVQPIKLESYSAHCNTQDLICVLVENILSSDEKTADVVIYVDSVNVVCQSTVPGSLPLPVPISCVEVGDDQQLPGLPLRVGEQHSFILRPVTPVSKLSPLNDTKGGRTGPGPGLGQELPPLDGSSFSRRNISKDTSSSAPVGAQYAVIVSCHCSHTESRLHYKHSLQWRPREPRDLLVSVSVETPSSDESTSELQPVFKSQVVTVQTTNLTSKDMNLTLLAPSSLANSPLSMVSFPAPLADSPITDGYSQQHSFTSNDANSNGSGQESGATSPVLEQSMSMQRSESSPLPPVQSIESVIGVSPILFRERNISAADIVADNSPARTHLWLQSTIPLGCVPAHSTTAVKCDILPLVDGIITLDTLHISKNERDALYIPESPLQIYTTSSIATGVA